MFKQFDSDPNLSGRMCFHTAFQDPNAPEDAPVRESIEIRAYAFFPDHEPNTCPDIVSEDEDDDDDLSEEELAKIVKQGVETVYYTLEGIHLWPETGATWLKGQLFMGENGIHRAANTLVRD